MLKKSGKRRELTFKLGASGSRGMSAGSATLQWADKDGRLAYALAGTLGHAGRRGLLDEWTRAYEADGCANLGAHYRLASKPLTVGGNLHYQGGGASRESSQLLAWQGARRALDMYALWKFSDQLRLRVSGANLLRQVERTRSLYADGGANLLRTVDMGSYRTLRVMLESSL